MESHFTQKQDRIQISSGAGTILGQGGKTKGCHAKYGSSGNILGQGGQD